MATCHKTAWELMCKDLLTDHSVTSKEKVEETLNEQSSQLPKCRPVGAPCALAGRPCHL